MLPTLPPRAAARWAVCRAERSAPPPESLFDLALCSTSRPAPAFNFINEFTSSTGTGVGSNFRFVADLRATVATCLPVPVPVKSTKLYHRSVLSLQSVL